MISFIAYLKWNNFLFITRYTCFGYGSFPLTIFYIKFSLKVSESELSKNKIYQDCTANTDLSTISRNNVALYLPVKNSEVNRLKIHSTWKVIGTFAAFKQGL